MTVKMSEVAKAAGLALSTVSEILKGKPGYNEETRHQVLAIARQLNYRPNPISRALSGGRSMSIGFFVTAEVTTFTVARRVQAVLQQAHLANYRVYVNHAMAPAAEAEAEGIAFVQDMLVRRVDGVIIDGYIAGEKLEELLNNLRFPLALITSRKWVKAARVNIDRAMGIGEAAKHLAELGHREVGIISVMGHAGASNFKLAIYQDALKTEGITPLSPKRWQVPQQSEVDERVYQMIREEARRGRLPTALMVANDSAAIAAIAAARDAGYRVPDDLSVVGFDDLPQARYFAPALTTIAFPCAEVGMKAFELLRQRIDIQYGASEESPESYASFGTRLVIRGSTGPASSR